MSLPQRRRGQCERRRRSFRDGPRLSQRQRLWFRNGHLHKLSLPRDLRDRRLVRSEATHAVSAQHHRRRKLLHAVSRPRLCARLRNALRPRRQKGSEEEVTTGTKISRESVRASERRSVRA